MAELELLRHYALTYASNGWRVFPVRAGAKEPATAHGVRDATTDQAQIRAWWQTIPYNIGVACGPESGIFVVDVDPRNGGSYTSAVPTARARSGGGGDHYFYLWPKGVAKMRKTLQPGVDVQGEGKYVLVAPSVTTDAYLWVDHSPPADAPPALLAEVAVVEGASSERPGDRFNREHTWAEILEPEGYRIDSMEGSVTRWTRPGKEFGVSVTTNYADSDLLYAFTTSTPFESERGYDKFGAWAVLHFGGNFEEAARALASTYESPRLAVTLGTSLSAPVAPPAALPSAPAPSPEPGAQPYEVPVHADHLLAHYLTYGAMVTDATPEYHEAGFLALMGVLTAGMRIAVAHTPEGLGTNLYLCLVGPSSIARKSTVQSQARWFLNRLRPNTLLPDRSSGESLIQELAQRHVACWMPDEFGLSLTEIYQRGGFLQALEQLILTLYSGQTFRYTTVSGGETLISGLDLSLFGAGTPESFSGAGARALATGLLPRVGIVYPATFPASRPPVDRTAHHDLWADALVARFRHVMEACLAPGGERVIRIEAGAFQVLSHADAEFGAVPITARLVGAAYKVAGLLALSDGRAVVSTDDARGALAITRRWAAGALRLRRYLGRQQGDEQFMEQVAHAREVLRTLPGTMGVDGRFVVSERAIARRLDLPASTIRRIRDTLEITGEITSTNEDWHLAL